MIGDAAHGEDLAGLARKCPKCGTIAHFKVTTRKETYVECPICDHNFKVKKFRRGERPKCKTS